MFTFYTFIKWVLHNKGTLESLFRVMQHTTLPRQPSGYDCGPYVIQFMKPVSMYEI